MPVQIARQALRVAAQAGNGHGSGSAPDGADTGIRKPSPSAASIAALGEDCDEWLGLLAYRVGSLGVVNVPGPIRYGGSGFGSGDGVQNAWLCEAFAACAEHPAVDRVLVDIHCPGGDIYGMSDLYQAAVRLADAKPVTAFAHDLCLSAAYWMASPFRIVATATAEVGSIGAAITYYDHAERFARDGVRPVHVRTGSLKAPGTAGVPISDEEEAAIRRQIDVYAALFVGAVAEHRRLTPEAVRGLEGDSFDAERARALGLVDDVTTAHQLYAEMLGGKDSQMATSPAALRSAAGTASATPPTTTRAAASAGGRPVPGADAGKPAATAEGPTREEIMEAIRAMDEDERKQMLAEYMPGDDEDDEPKGEDEPKDGDEPKDDDEPKGEDKPKDDEPKGEDKPKDAAPAASALTPARAMAMLTEAKVPTAQANAMGMKALAAGYTEQQLAAMIDGLSFGVAGGNPSAEADGVSPEASGLPTRAGGGGDKPAAEHPYLAEVRRVQREEGLSLSKATAMVNQKRPDLREQYANRAG